MADVFSSQSGIIEFKSPDVPLLVDIKGNLSVDNTIISPDTKDLILSSGSKTVIIDTGGSSMITTPTDHSLIIKPDKSLVLNTTIWPATSGLQTDKFLLKTGNQLSWTSSLLANETNPALAGNLNVTGYIVYTGTVPAVPVPIADNNMRFSSSGEIQLSSNTSSVSPPAGSTPATILTTKTISGSSESLVISPTGNLYLTNYVWPKTSVSNIGYVLTITGSGGQLGFTPAQGINALFDDKTPTLGGDLNTNDFSIFSPASADVKINAGTGKIVFNGNSADDTEIAPNDDQSLWIRGGPNAGDLHLDPGAGGFLYINQMQWPIGAGTAGQILQTNGTNLEWANFSSSVVNSVTGTDGVRNANNITTGDVVLLVDDTVVRTTGDQSITGNIDIVGDLNVSGTIYSGGQILQVDQIVTTGDGIIILNSAWPTNTSPTENAGMYVYRGDIPGTYQPGIIWDETTDKWVISIKSSPTVTDNYPIWNLSFQGPGTGMDSDLLDGQQGSYYLNSANLTGIIPTSSIPAFTGDVTSAIGTTVNTLATTGVVAGSYGGGTIVPTFTVDAKGRITSASNVTIPTASTTVAGLVELATTAETTAGTDAARAVTPNSLAAVTATLQPKNASLTSISSLTSAANTMLYTTATNTFATAAITAFGRNLIDETDASTARITLGLGTAATKDASTTNTPDTVVLRDSSGNIPNLSVGNASTADALSPGATINGVNFTGASAITVYDNTKLPLAGGTMTGTLLTAAGVGATTVGTQSEGSLGVRGSASTGAVMSFHRASAYAVNFGLDTDNVVRLGGWSDGANVYRWWSDQSGNFTARGDVTAYSDIRLKTNIQVIPNALDKVCSLRGVTYDRIDTHERQTGLIAQELYDVLPEAVHIGTDEEQTMSVAYGNVIGLLVESIKELRAEIEALKADK